MNIVVKASISVPISDLHNLILISCIHTQK